MGNLFSELKRRNVVRVGLAYVVLGWVALQVGDVLFDMFEAPVWVGKTFAALLLLGFPFACLFAWAFELTPEGLRRTEDADAEELDAIAAQPAGRRWPIGLAALAGVILIGCKYGSSAAPQWECPTGSGCYLMGSAKAASFCLAEGCDATAGWAKDGCRDGASEVVFETSAAVATVPQGHHLAFRLTSTVDDIHALGICKGLMD